MDTAEVMSNPITRFEYDYLNRHELTKEEIEELSIINQEGKFYFQKEGDKIKLSQYVGLILLSTGKVIEILPKIYRHNEGNTEIYQARKLLTILFYEFLDLAKRPSSGGSFHSEKTDFNIPFLEILILMVLNYIEKKIIQPGIYKDYLRKKLSLRSLNGKLLLSQTLLKFPFQKDRFEIEKEVLTSNILINRVLSRFVEFVAVKFSNSRIKNLAGRISLYLRNIGVESSKNIVEDLKKIHLNRMNDHYQPVIQFAKFFFSGNNITGSQGNSFVFLYDMNKLFEKFVASSLSGCLSQTEEKIDEDFSLKPDILWPLEKRKHIVIDTKWKFPTNTSSENRGVSQSDRFQVITYMYVLPERKNIEIPLGILLYPEFPPPGKKVWVISRQKKLAALGLGLKELIEDEVFSNEKNLDIQTRYLKKRIREKIEREIEAILS
ncbi:MAG: hypothetical protein ABGX27_05525 [Desulfurobacteriaceae bacterium]